MIWVGMLVGMCLLAMLAMFYAMCVMSGRLSRAEENAGLQVVYHEDSEQSWALDDPEFLAWLRHQKILG